MYLSSYYSNPLCSHSLIAGPLGDTEVLSCLAALKSSAQDTGLMHESFSVLDASDYTRAWFAWANGLFAGELNRLALSWIELN